MNRRFLISLLAAGAVAACDDTPVSPAVESSILSLIGGLEPGEAFTLSGADAGRLYLTGGKDGAEYLLVPFHGTASAAELAVEISGDGVSAALPQQARVATGATVPAAVLRRIAADEAHRRIRARSLEQTRHLVRAETHGFRSLAERDARAWRGDVVPLAIPQPGDLVQLNAEFDDPCANPDDRSGQVVRVGQHAVLVADLANPAGGFTAADYAAMASEFDELIHPVVSGTFGEATDLDGNARAVIFFTSAVNDLTPPGAEGIVLGLFHPRDLFPRVSDARFEGCPTSNYAELFYVAVPDPARAQQDPAFSKEFITGAAMGVLGHEYQHLVNSARRLYINLASDWPEEAWLDEGLSHIAEELLFYEAAGLEPGANLDLPAITQSSVVDAANTYMLDNLLRYGYFLEHPDQSALFDAQPTLGTRGAIWSFLRYVADHEAEGGSEFFHDLVNSTATGLDNLRASVDSDVLELARAWAAAVYLDDTGTGIPGRYTQPSWNLRSLLSFFYTEFPLATQPLGPGGGAALSLKGGGAAFVRVGVDGSARASIATKSGGSAPSDDLSLTVVRTR